MPDTIFSFEFFPPKTPKGLEKLMSTAKTFAQFNPDFFSVTFGAGGSNREKTTEAVFDLIEYTGIPVAPHISCISATRKNIRDMLNTYENHGVSRLVALRGDLPPGEDSNIGDLKHATELVAFIRETSGDYFHIEVAAYPEVHPQAANAVLDLKFFKEKVDAGANSAITQYFYNIDAYKRFIDSCQQQQINIPIVPGIMPIHNCLQLERFSDMCGAELPRWIRKKLESMKDNEEAMLEFGVDFVTELCEKLLALGAPGLHFYTLNRTDITMKICNNLNIKTITQQREKA
jgi:methylenetetrahydrofolate reductase (NADPH)